MEEPPTETSPASSRLEPVDAADRPVPATIGEAPSRVEGQAPSAADSQAPEQPGQSAAVEFEAWPRQEWRPVGADGAVAQGGYELREFGGEEDTLTGVSVTAPGGPEWWFDGTGSPRDHVEVGRPPVTGAAPDEPGASGATDLSDSRRAPSGRRQPAAAEWEFPEALMTARPQEQVTVEVDREGAAQLPLADLNDPADT